MGSENACSSAVTAGNPVAHAFEMRADLILLEILPVQDNYVEAIKQVLQLGLFDDQVLDST